MIEKIVIDYSGDLMGCQMFDESDNAVMHFEELERKEQIKVLNGFAQFYKLFSRCLKEE